MAYIVRKKATGLYLTSPDRGTLRGKRDDIWFWSLDEKDAHHFQDRADAKDTLRFIDRRPGANLVSECTFYKVK